MFLISLTDLNTLWAIQNLMKNRKRANCLINSIGSTGYTLFVKQSNNHSENSDPFHQQVATQISKHLVLNMRVWDKTFNFHDTIYRKKIFILER